MKNNTILDSWEEEYYQKHPKPLPLEDCEVGDLIKFVDTSGNVDESVITGIVPMFVRNKKEYQMLLLHPRTKMRRDILFSNIRVEKIINKKQLVSFSTKVFDLPKKSSEMYYLLCK